MLGILGAFLSGLVFGVGLMISRMIDPAKVLDFLAVFGNWDPSLAVVMAAAVPVAAIGFALARYRRAPFLAPDFSLPSGAPIDWRLLLGAALFGLGWGLVGYCPGPALASLPLGRWETGIFVLAMLAGMAGFELLKAPARRRPAAGKGLDVPVAGSPISAGNATEARSADAMKGSGRICGGRATSVERAVATMSPAARVELSRPRRSRSMVPSRPIG